MYFQSSCGNSIVRAQTHTLVTCLCASMITPRPYMMRKLLVYRRQARCMLLGLRACSSSQSVKQVILFYIHSYKAAVALSNTYALGLWVDSVPVYKGHTTTWKSNGNLLHAQHMVLRRHKYAAFHMRYCGLIAGGACSCFELWVLPTSHSLNRS